MVHFEPELTAAGVRELADAIAAVCGGWAAVYSGDDEMGYGLCMVTAQGDLRAMGAEAVKALNGRGGGKPTCFQGSFKTTKAEIEQFFKS